ncbi:hypothetical protein OSB04_003349 [Centaurea solstitialis]|uniref:Retrotransposon Copia-like N-terminal domain-containing protein n=1 Tax=Centaurea solstitialis TaxID=347529 RepID=A0AA38UCE8_9ASTR|nr:hypothetical protein OSB04_003349 [Centaurea solstitialis]
MDNAPSSTRNDANHAGIILLLVLRWYFVSQPLTGDNYNNWSRALRVAQSVKEKVEFVIGFFTEPQGAKNLNDLYQMYNVLFPMGLEDCFSLIRGEILLMDPMPLII